MPYHPPPVALGLVAEAVPKFVGTNRGAALGGTVAVWQRQPAGVLCVELLEFRIAPYLLELEQTFLGLAARYLTQLAKPLSLPRILQER